jgi:hypothetical protein
MITTARNSAVVGDWACAAAPVRREARTVPKRANRDARHLSLLLSCAQASSDL